MMAMPGEAPHYFSAPNYANSPLRLSEALVALTGGGGTGADNCLGCRRPVTGAHHGDHGRHAVAVATPSAPTVVITTAVVTPSHSPARPRPSTPLAVHKRYRRGRRGRLRRCPASASSSTRSPGLTAGGEQPRPVHPGAPPADHHLSRLRLLRDRSSCSTRSRCTPTCRRPRCAATCSSRPASCLAPAIALTLS